MLGQAWRTLRVVICPIICPVLWAAGGHPPLTFLAVVFKKLPARSQELCLLAHFCIPQYRGAPSGPLYLLLERNTVRDQNQQDSPTRSLTFTWEPYQGSQDGEGGSSQTGFVNDVFVSGLRNLTVCSPRLSELTVNVAVGTYVLHYSECALCSPETTQQDTQK